MGQVNNTMIVKYHTLWLWNTLCWDLVIRIEDILYYSPLYYEIKLYSKTWHAAQIKWSLNKWNHVEAWLHMHVQWPISFEHAYQCINNGHSKVQHLNSKSPLCLNQYIYCVWLHTHEQRATIWMHTLVNWESRQSLWWHQPSSRNIPHASSYYETKWDICGHLM